MPPASFPSCCHNQHAVLFPDEAGAVGGSSDGLGARPGHLSQLQRIFIVTPSSSAPLACKPVLQFTGPAPQHAQHHHAQQGQGRGAAQGVEQAGNGGGAGGSKGHATTASPATGVFYVTLKQELVLPADSLCVLSMPFVYAKPQVVGVSAQADTSTTGAAPQGQGQDHQDQGQDHQGSEPTTTPAVASAANGITHHPTQQETPPSQAQQQQQQPTAPPVLAPVMQVSEVLPWRASLLKGTMLFPSSLGMAWPSG